MNWDDVGDAIQAAFARASGLSSEQVIWKDQNRTAPAPPYMTLRLGGPLTLGIDYLSTTFDDSRPRGQEVELRVRGMREVPLEVECFTTESVSGRSNSALALCARTLTSLVLPSVRQLLAAQDVSPFDPGTPQWIPDVPSTHFRGRAVATVRCYMPPPTAVEYVGYIERFSGEVHAVGAGGGEDVFAFDGKVGEPVEGDED
jgi:hypothetical protein